VTIKLEDGLEKSSSPPPQQSDKSDQEHAHRQGFWKLVKDVYPTVPHKPFLFLGVVACLIHGAATPVFSFLLSKLFFEVSIGATHVGTINMYGAIVLSIAAGDGFLFGLKYFIMETVGVWWTTRLRNTSFEILLKQDKKFFDQSKNAPWKLGQVLIKDGDDAKNLIAVVLGQCLVVIAMLGAGLIWAMVVGWQLTLVGIGFAPVFALAMTLQTGLVGKCELRNKRVREEVAKGYYESISNIRGIRSMGLESAFKVHFDKASNAALKTGSRGAFVEGCTYGVASSFIYLAEALLFYVGAILIANGTYTYLKMVQVLNLVVFTVVLASQS
jgi:ATP-binding cassette subfamily B (MDR/TAP) protein 1